MLAQCRLQLSPILCDIHIFTVYDHLVSAVGKVRSDYDRSYSSVTHVPHSRAESQTRQAPPMMGTATKLPTFVQ